MGRTLPWLKDQPASLASRASKASTNAASNIAPTPKRRRITVTPSEDESDLNTTGVSTPQRRARLRPPRTPSTSPPPAPPKQEPMRTSNLLSGGISDDVWIMVEDEFLSTAQLYTQHLHHAEYQRLKKLVAGRGNDVLRPVDGRTAMPGETKAAIAKQAQGMRVVKGLKDATEAGDEDADEAWVGDPVLGNLMDSPRKPARMLKSMGAGRSETRAAVGLKRPDTKDKSVSPTKGGSNGSSSRGVGDSRPSGLQAPSAPNRRLREMSTTEQNHVEGDDDEDDDDLDKPVKTSLKQAPVTAPSASKSAAPKQSSKPKQDIDSRSRNLHRATTMPKPHRDVELVDFAPPPRRPASESKESKNTYTSISKKLSSPDRFVPEPAASGYLARKKARLAEKQKQMEKERPNTAQKPNDTTEIPTFLF